MSHDDLLHRLLADAGNNESGARGLPDGRGAPSAEPESRRGLFRRKARRSPLPIGGRSAPRLPASFSISYESEVQVVPLRSQLGERMMLSPIFFLSAELRPDPARPPTACSSSISSGTWRWFKTVTSHAGQRKSPDWRGFPRWGRTGLEPVTPSLSTLASSSTLADEVRQTRRTGPFVGSQEKTVLATFARLALTRG